MRLINSSLSFRIVLFLALLQGIFGLLRAYGWVQLGADLFGQGLLFLPVVGAFAVMRGLFISAVALMYVLSVVGALLGREWAWWSCLAAVSLNLLLVVFGLIRGAPFLDAVVWAAVPVILLVYLFSASKGSAVRSA